MLDRIITNMTVLPRKQQALRPRLLLSTGCLATLFLVPGYAQVRSTSHSPTPRSLASEQALVQQYCVSCHNAKAKSGNLELDPSTLSDVGQSPAKWEKVVSKLRLV